MLILNKGLKVFHTTNLPWKMPEINTLTWCSKTPYYARLEYPQVKTSTYHYASPTFPILLKKKFTLLNVGYESAMTLLSKLPFIKDYLNALKCDGFYTHRSHSVDSGEITYLLFIRDESDILGLPNKLIDKSHLTPVVPIFQFDLFIKRFIKSVLGFFEAILQSVKIVYISLCFRATIKKLRKKKYTQNKWNPVPRKKRFDFRICTWNVHNFKNVYFKNTKLICEREIKNLNANVVCLQECFNQHTISSKTSDKSNIILSEFGPQKHFKYVNFGSVAVAACFKNIAILSVHLNVTSSEKRLDAMKYFLKAFHQDCHIKTKVILGDFNMVLRKHYSKQEWDCLQHERVHKSEDDLENLLLTHNYVDVFGHAIANTCWSGRRVDYIYLNTDQDLTLSPWTASMRHASDHICLGLDIS